MIPAPPHQVETKYSPGTSPVLCFFLLLVTVELRTFPWRVYPLLGCHLWVPSLCFSPKPWISFQALSSPAAPPSRGLANIPSVPWGWGSRESALHLHSFLVIWQSSIFYFT